MWSVPRMGPFPSKATNTVKQSSENLNPWHFDFIKFSMTRAWKCAIVHTNCWLGRWSKGENTEITNFGQNCQNCQNRCFDSFECSRTSKKIFLRIASNLVCTSVLVQERWRTCPGSDRSTFAKSSILARLTKDLGYITCSGTPGFHKKKSATLGCVGSLGLLHECIM